MMTAHGSTQIVREAFKLGVEDFLEKPFEVDELLALARRAVKSLRLQTQRQYLISERDAEFNHYGIVGRSRAMQDVIERAELVAQTKSTVLITGETGTGKEMVARLIHHRSAQRDMPLIKVNCAAIPETLLESELFGHVRGAFTGATMTKRGKFALADGGSIFLDEIGTLTPAIQSKLLRVLQEREFEPLGAERTHRVDVRVIAATNRDLKQMVSDARFQEDLYYRLNVIPIPIPAAARAARGHPGARRSLRGEALPADRQAHRADRGRRRQVLQRYDWPGNVRELENTIERCGRARRPMRRSPAAAISLLGATSTPAPGLPSLRLHQNLEWVERETIRRALEQAGGVKKDAAELMGISQRALSYYLAKYRID